MFVAVVYFDHSTSDNNESPYNSHKPNMDWSCFLGATKEDATKALAAANKWNGPGFSPDSSSSKFYGPYQVLIGELTSEASVPIQFDTYKG